MKQRTHLSEKGYLRKDIREKKINAITNEEYITDTLLHKVHNITFFSDFSTQAAQPRFYKKYFFYLFVCYRSAENIAL
jgi:hypothetical protein